MLTLFSDDLFSLENLLLTVEQEAKELPLKFQIENQESSLVDLKKKVNLHNSFNFPNSSIGRHS